MTNLQKPLSNINLNEAIWITSENNKMLIRLGSCSGLIPWCSGWSEHMSKSVFFWPWRRTTRDFSSQRVVWTSSLFNHRIAKAQSNMCTCLAWQPITASIHKWEMWHWVQSHKHTPITVCVAYGLTRFKLFLTVLRPLNYGLFQIMDVKVSVDFLLCSLRTRWLNKGIHHCWNLWLTETKFKLHLLKNYFYNHFLSSFLAQLDNLITALFKLNEWQYYFWNVSRVQPGGGGVGLFCWRGGGSYFRPMFGPWV